MRHQLVHVSPYNEFAPQDYSVETFNDSLCYKGHAPLYKKGVIAQIIGAVVAVVATVFTAGLAAPVMAGVFGTGMVASLAAGAIGGMVGGALGAFVAGNDVGKGALFGAIGGGITGGMGGFAAGDGALGSVYSAGSDVGNSMVGSTAGSTVGASGTAIGTVAGDVAAPAANAGVGGTESTLMNNASGSLTNPAASGVTGSVTEGLNGVTAPTAGLDVSQAGGQVNLGNSAQLANGTTNAASPAAAPKTFMDKAGDFLSSDKVTNAGLKVGAQYLGSMANAPGAAAETSYLNDVKAMEQQTQQFNMDQANKKAAVGDKLQSAADNIDPQYYAQQGQTQQKNRTAASWADTEQRMRAQGASQDAIDAERNRSAVTGSQNEGTAYDAGMQSGRTQQTSTYGTAGSMYGGVSQPTAGLAQAYGDINKENAKAQTAAGNSIEQVFGVANDSTRKPAQASI
jgi:hypothetical protein